MSGNTVPVDAIGFGAVGFILRDARLSGSDRLRRKADVARPRVRTVPPVTLGEGLAGRDNALNFVRLVLAASVVVSHGWLLGGFGAEPSFGDLALGTWAVLGFFAISGYLVAGSRARLRLGAFAVARALRIFPGYWLALVTVAFVFAPVAGLIAGTRQDFSGGLRYVLVNCSTWLFDWTIGSAIDGAPRAALWDGPLWTLALELGCYIVVAAAFCLSSVRRRPGRFAGGLLVIVTTINASVAALGGGLGSYMVVDFVRLLGFFAAGMCAWALRDAVRVRAWVMSVSVVACVVMALTGTASVLAPVPVAYLALAAGAGLPVRWGAVTDLSYGIYLFGWPVQQVLWLLGVADWGVVLYVAAALFTTALLAALSWHGVERPALRFKRTPQAIRRASAVVAVSGGGYVSDQECPLWVERLDGVPSLASHPGSP